MSLNDEVTTTVDRLRQYNEPIVKALIEAVTQTHKYCEGRGEYRYDSPDRNDYERCGRCKGTGHVSRDWEEIGEYALWGVLVGVASAHPVLTTALAQQQQPDNHYLHVRQQADHAFDEWTVQTRDAEHPGSTALAAVGKALEQMFGGSHDQDAS